MGLLTHPDAFFRVYFYILSSDSSFMGKFILKKTKNDGFMFNLLATNGQVI